MKRHLSDVLFIAVVLLVVLITTSLPYWLQARQAPAGEHFGGIIFALADQNSYLMWMRQAAQGQVWWRDLMTTDPHQPFYTNLLWLGLGRLAGRPENMLLVYHAARVGCSLLLLMAVYALLGAVLRGTWERRVALLLIATGDGLFWLFFGLHQPGPQGLPPGTAAFAAPELLAWPSMALLPHFAAGMAAMAGVFYLALAAYRRPERWAAYAAAGGLLLAVLAGFHVYDVVTVSAVLVVHWIVAQRAGQAPPHAAQALAVILAPGVVVTLLVEAMLSRSPIGRAWGQSNLMLSWSPLTYAVGLGVPLIVALADHRRLFHWREMSVAEILPPIWLLVNVPLLFTDGIIPFERRLMMGIQIPVVMLAVATWGKYVVPRLAGRTPGKLPLALAWGILLLMTWPGLLLRMNYYATDTAYLSDDFLAAAHTLAALPPGHGVLCRATPGNWLPQLTGQAVYVGHNELTPDATERKQEVAAFFDPATSDPVRQALLAKSRCDYVLAEGEDRAALTGGWLVPVESRGEVGLYAAGGQAPPNPGLSPAPPAPGATNHTDNPPIHPKFMPLAAFKLLDEHPLPLNAAPFTVSTPEGDATVANVRLVEARYRRTISPPEGPAGNAVEVWCYELKPTNERIHWTWAVCDFRPSYYTDVVCGHSAAYFTWISTAVLSFEPIAKPRDRAAAVEAFYRWEIGAPPPDLVAFSPTMLLGNELFDIHSPTSLKIKVLSIEPGADTTWTLRITGKDPGKVFTFVGKDAQWRAQ